MKKLDRGLVLGLVALGLYIVGGVATFGGLAMIVVMQNHYVAGIGDAGTFGYVFVCVGLCVSIAGVLCMRVLRNRRLA